MVQLRGTIIVVTGQLNTTLDARNQSAVSSKTKNLNGDNAARTTARAALSNENRPNQLK